MPDLISSSSPNLRWLQATKSIISGTNTQALTAKADLLKEEMDESMNKVELCKVSSRMSTTHVSVYGNYYIIMILFFWKYQ